jgi:hypothetical protein
VSGPHVSNDLEDAVPQAAWRDAELGAQAGVVNQVVGGAGFRALEVLERDLGPWQDTADEVGQLTQAGGVAAGVVGDVRGQSQGDPGEGGGNVVHVHRGAHRVGVAEGHRLA